MLAMFCTFNVGRSGRRAEAAHGAGVSWSRTPTAPRWPTCRTQNLVSEERERRARERVASRVRIDTFAAPTQPHPFQAAIAKTHRELHTTSNSPCVCPRRRCGSFFNTFSVTSLNHSYKFVHTFISFAAVSQLRQF